jgi:chromosome segregation ATPase
VSDRDSLERDILQYKYTLERLASIIEVHQGALEKIDSRLELLRMQRNTYRDRVNRLQEMRLKRGETEIPPVEEKLREDLTRLNASLEQLDFQFEEQSELIDYAQKEYDLEASEILPKIEELEEKLQQLN